MATCDECMNEPYCDSLDDLPCALWHPIPCPACAGRLSAVRTNGPYPVRHCYSCNMDFPVDENGTAHRLEEVTILP